MDELEASDSDDVKRSQVETKEGIARTEDRTHSRKTIRLTQVKKMRKP